MWFMNLDKKKKREMSTKSYPMGGVWPRPLESKNLRYGSRPLLWMWLLLSLEQLPWSTVTISTSSVSSTDTDKITRLWLRLAFSIVTLEPSSYMLANNAGATLSPQREREIVIGIEFGIGTTTTPVPLFIKKLFGDWFRKSKNHTCLLIMIHLWTNAFSKKKIKILSLSHSYHYWYILFLND